MPKHYVGEAGVDLILDTGIDIGSVAEQYIRWQNPSGVEGTFAANLYGSYSALAKLVGSYLLKYTLEYGDLYEAGTWEFQAWCAAADGTWWGETVSLEVMNPFE